MRQCEEAEGGRLTGGKGKEEGKGKGKGRAPKRTTFPLAQRPDQTHPITIARLRLTPNLKFSSIPDSVTIQVNYPLGLPNP